MSYFEFSDTDSNDEDEFCFFDDNPKVKSEITETLEEKSKF